MPAASPLPRRATALLAACALAGCGVGPRYQRPALDVPAGFTAAHESAPAAPPLDWWRGFGSPELDTLIGQAAAASPDVQAAAARIVQADQAARIAGSPLLPGITGSAGENWQRTGNGSTSGFGNLAALGLGGLGRGGSHYSEIRTYSAELSASYEVDFWGKNRDALRAAEALALSSRYDAQTVWLTTSSSIATTYFQAAGFRDRLAIARHNLQSASDVLDAFRGRLAVGTASLLDLRQQEALVAGYRAQIPSLQSQYAQEVIALATLVGRPPERIVLDPAPLTALRLPPIAAGLPADLLRRRPDIASAEAQLVSQNQTVRQDFANLFPSFTLTASGGLSSLALSAITGPGTVVASLAAQLAQTIFDNGLKLGTLGQARGRYRELVADYVKAVLQAMADTEMALTQLAYAAEQERLEAEAVRTAQSAADIARAQLSAGTVDIVTVLNTEATLFGDQDALAQVRIARTLAVVALYRALGGGWSSDRTQGPA